MKNHRSMTAPLYNTRPNLLRNDAGAQRCQVFVCGLALLATTSVGYAQSKKFPSVAEQCKQVSQDASATWRTIPWQTDLLAAQKIAAEQQKPLFVWAMDGHPLGCT